MPFVRLFFISLFLSLQLWFGSLFASSIDGQTVTFTRLLQEMQFGKPDTVLNNDGSTYLVVKINNVKIEFDRRIDNKLDERYKNGGTIIRIPYTVHLNDCQFSTVFWYQLRDIEFGGYLAFFRCTNIKAKFSHCRFAKTFRMYNSEVDFFQFTDCKFDHGFKMARSPVSDYLSFYQCDFSIALEHIYDSPNMDMEARLFTFQNKLNPVDMSFEKCQFIVPDTIKKDLQYMINMLGSNFNNLKFNECHTNVPINLSQSSVVNQFTCFQSVFDSYIIVDAFNFNPSNAKVQWSAMAGSKLALLEANTGHVITGKSVNALSDEFLYNSLVSCYAMFYNSYREQGNRISANASYKEWKDIETIYLKHLLHERYNFNTYFNWLMNVFLDAFCDYGTNPIKSIRWSFYVMSFFALIYFFFPYEGGVFGRKSFFSRISLYIHYFISGKSLTELYQEKPENSQIEKKTLSEYMEYIEANRQKLPVFIRIFGRQIFRIEKIKASWYRRYYVFLDRITGKWESLKGRRKALATVLYGFIIFLVLSALLLKRIVDCLTLSLNAFSTLGFGEIPVEGAAKYFTVVEGFVGWFLLSIFSVALISQIIQ